MALGPTLFVVVGFFARLICPIVLVRKLFIAGMRALGALLPRVVGDTIPEHE